VVRHDGSGWLALGDVWPGHLAVADRALRPLLRIRVEKALPRSVANKMTTPHLPGRRSARLDWAAFIFQSAKRLDVVRHLVILDAVGERSNGPQGSQSVVTKDPVIEPYRGEGGRRGGGEDHWRWTSE
jgi:hypothetical protein